MDREPLRSALLVAGAALLCAYFAFWAGVTTTQQRQSDFSIYYSAAGLLRQGEAGKLYDQAAEQRQHTLILPQAAHLSLPFNTPPLTAWLVAPFTYLSPENAYRLFSALQFLALGAAILIAARAAPWYEVSRHTRAAIAVTGLAGIATLPQLLLGQWDGITALGLALAYRSWRKGQLSQAGLFLGFGFGLAKPHLAAGIVLFLLGYRAWRTLAATAFGFLLLIALSILVVGIIPVTTFFTNVIVAAGNTPADSTLGFLGFFASWIHTPLPDAVLAAVFGVAALAAAAHAGALSRRNSALFEIGLTAAITLSLVSTIHLLSHDLVLLEPAFIWVAARMKGYREQVQLLLGWVFINCLLAFDAGASGPAPPGRVVPIGLSITAAVLIYRMRSRAARLNAGVTAA